MMGSRRTNEKDRQPTSTNPLIQPNCNAPNVHLTRSTIFQEGNVSAGNFDSIPDSSPLFAHTWENLYSMNQPITQINPETSGNPMAYFTNPSTFQNPQINLNSSTPKTDLSEFPVLPEWNTIWGPQFTNQGHSAMLAGGMNDVAGFSNFESTWSSNSPITARNFTGDLQMNNRHDGDSKFGHFNNRPQLDSPFVRSPLHFNTRNNVNFNTSQCGVQGKLEGNFLSLGIGSTQEPILPTSQPISREMSHKLKEAASTELKMGRARKAMGQSQTLDANFTTGFHNTNHMDRITSTGNESGVVHCTPNSVPGSFPYHFSEMKQNDMQPTFPSSRNIGSYGDANHYRAFVGNQAVNSGTIGGGNSGQFLNSQQFGLNRSTMSHTPSGQLQNIRFKTANSLPLEGSMNSSLKLGSSSTSTRQNYAGKNGDRLQLHNHMPTPTQGLFSQRTAVPQVSWVSSGPQGVTDLPFPKRLGVEFNNSTQATVAPMGTRLQTTSTGQSQTCQFSNNAVRPDGARVSYPLNSQQQQQFFTHAQFQSPVVQPPSSNSVCVRPYHKRTAVAPPSGPHWVQRQKMTHVAHPTVHQSTPIRFPTKPTTTPTPVTTPLVLPSIPVIAQSQTQRIPHTSNFRPRVPVTTAPIVAHIARKVKSETTTPQVKRYKCLLCKRDLSLTSEGAVYQPTAPPAVAVLPCGHTFHDECLQKITPQDQAKDPPCIPCALGEN